MYYGEKKGTQHMGLGLFKVPPPPEFPRAGSVVPDLISSILCIKRGKCSPREQTFFTETSHSCINYSKASSPIYTYFWARGLWLYLKSQLLLSDSIFTRSSLQIMKKDRIFHLWEFTNNTTQLVKPVAYYNFTFYLDDSKCTFSSKVWESSVGRHPSGRL